MNDIFAFAAMTVVGFCLGAMFFAVLWWTTNKGLTSNQPVLWFAGSFFGRTIVLLVSLYHLCNADWHRLIACLIGFTVARMILLRILPSQSLQRGRP